MTATLTWKELLELQDELFDCLGLLVKIRDHSDDPRVIRLAALAGRHARQVNSHLEGLRELAVPPSKRMGRGPRPVELDSAS